MALDQTCKRVALTISISPLVSGGGGVILCASFGIAGDSDGHCKYTSGFVAGSLGRISFLLKALVHLRASTLWVPTYVTVHCC